MSLTPLGGLLIAILLFLREEHDHIGKTLALVIIIVAGVLFIVDLLRPYAGKR